MKYKTLLVTALCCFSVLTVYGATNLQEMFTQGYGTGQLRTMTFERSYDSSKADMAEQAIGGIFHYRTDQLYGVSFGVGFYTSNNINSDDDDSGYDLLNNEDGNKHKSYTKMAEYFVQGDWYNTVIKYGAQEVDTPFVNGFDTRMTPKAYQGLSVVNNSLPGLEVSLYYLTDFMDRTETEFSSIAYSFDENMDENPLISAGLKYSANLSEDIKLVPQLWYYTIEDGFEFAYAKAELSAKAGKYKLSVAPSYLCQQAIGDKSGGSLDTYQYGVVGTAGAYNFTLSLYYAKTGDDTLVVPWGNSKVVSQQVLTSARADEKVYAAKLKYDFSGLGAKGLAFSIFYAKYDTPDSGNNASYDANETDYDLTYKFQGYLKGLGLRARYADINADSDFKGVDQTDKRFYVTYDFTFGNKPKK